MTSEREISDCLRTGAQTAEWVHENFLNPLIDSALIEPVDTVAQAAARLCGQKKTAEPLIPRLQAAACQDYSPEFWTQNLARGLGSAVPYGLAGRFGCGTLRTAGAAAKARGLWERAATSEAAGQILGAVMFDSMKELPAGQTWAGTAFATAGSFGIYEAGNHFSQRLGLPGRLAARLATGATGSTFQFAVCNAGELASGKALSDPELKSTLTRDFAASVTTGAFLNSVLPASQEAMRKIEDKANHALHLGIPAERHVERNFTSEDKAALAPQLKKMRDEHPWARVQSGSEHTAYRAGKDLIEIKKGTADLPELVHELTHRAEARSKLAEPGFKLAAEHLKAGDESKSWQVFRSVRLAQETRARLAEERARQILEPGYSALDAQAVKSSVPNLTAGKGSTYEQLWREEFQEFKQSNGKSRPRIDFNDEETERLLGKQRSRLIKLSGGEKHDLIEVMKDVEGRAGLDRAVIAEIYRDLCRMLSGNSKAPAEREPAKLARDVLNLVADPTEVTQGNHPTCGPASLEYLYYNSFPLTATRLVSQVAREESFTTTDGTVISLSPLSIRNEKLWNRSHANQIFQTAAINAHWQRQERFYRHLGEYTTVSKNGFPGFLRYERMPTNNLKQSPFRLMDYAQSPARPMISDNYGARDFIPSDPFMNKHALEDIHDQLAGTGSRDITGPDYFLTPEALDKTLREARSNRELPLLLGVDTRQPPFAVKGIGPETGGRHLIAVTAYDPLSGRVSIFNPWGWRYQRGGLLLPELWRATRSPDAPAQPTMDRIYDSVRKLSGIDDEHV